MTMPAERTEALIHTEPTAAQLYSACLSCRHDYGLLSDEEKRLTRHDAREWLRAWEKEGWQPPKEPS